MSEIVERVARALYERSDWYRFNDGNGNKIPFESLGKINRVFIDAHAQAAIAAMREPTQGMIEACGADDYYDSFDLRRWNWQTMIDEALK